MPAQTTGDTVTANMATQCTHSEIAMKFRAHGTGQMLLVKAKSKLKHKRQVSILVNFLFCVSGHIRV